MVKLKPHNYSCVKCERKQYTNEKCYGCGGKVFAELKNNGDFTVSLTEELDMIANWGFIVSTERPLNEKEKELYFKLTEAPVNPQTYLEHLKEEIFKGMGVPKEYLNEEFSSTRLYTCGKCERKVPSTLGGICSDCFGY